MALAVSAEGAGKNCCKCPNCGHSIDNQIEIEYITPRQAERLCGGAIAEWTWRQLALKEKLPRLKRCNRVFFRIDDVRAFLEGGEEQWRGSQRRQEASTNAEKRGGSAM